MRLELYLEGTDPYSQGWNAATRAMATADVVERKHGRWKVRSRTDKWEYCECQNCGDCYNFDIGERFRYCPNCGAEMDERRGTDV